MSGSDPWESADLDISPEQMQREVESNPDLKAALSADVFIDCFCVRCGSGGAPFATPVWHVSCPRCLAQRMRGFLARREGLPWWERTWCSSGSRRSSGRWRSPSTTS